MVTAALSLVGRGSRLGLNEVSEKKRKCPDYV